MSSQSIIAANGKAQPAPKLKAVTLRDLAIRLTPNPALTIDGTLEIILDGIDRIDDQALARALARANMAEQLGRDPGPISDEQWNKGPLEIQIRLLQAARNLKQALRFMAE